MAVTQLATPLCSLPPAPVPGFHLLGPRPSAFPLRWHESCPVQRLFCCNYAGLDACRDGASCLIRNERRARRVVIPRAKKKPWWFDPFDYGEDPLMENGALFGDGLQEPEEPMPPLDPSSEFGYRDFPAGFNVEIASLGLLLRGDVRRCCCFVAGGVYENLLFFPVIQLLIDRYPGVHIDIVATERGKQTYEINKNVKRAWVYDFDAQFVPPDEYTEFIGKIKNEYYDMIVSTKLAGVGHSVTLWLTDARDRISYVHPNVNAAGSGLFLTEALKAPYANLADCGYNMYAQLLDVLAKPGRNIPVQKVQPLGVSISKRLKEFVQKKYSETGVNKGEFVVFHGIQSSSHASMQSRSDHDSLLPLEIWSELARSTSKKVVFVIPNNLERLRVWEVIGEDTKMVFITTPGQLAAIINDSVGVVTTNTAAVQLACALRKPCVALFSSLEKASLFVPDATDKKCMLVGSKTGRLVDIDIKAAITAMAIISEKATVSV